MQHSLNYLVRFILENYWDFRYQKIYKKNTCSCDRFIFCVHKAICMKINCKIHVLMWCWIDFRTNFNWLTYQPLFLLSQTCKVTFPSFKWTAVFEWTALTQTDLSLEKTLYHAVATKRHVCYKLSLFYTFSAFKNFSIHFFSL